MINSSVKKILKNESQVPAVVLPLNYNGILFTRALHSKKVPVIGMHKTSKVCFYKTNSCKKVLAKDLYGEDCLKVLLEMGEISNLKPALIPISDEGVKFILAHKNELIKYYRINLPERETAEILLEKEKLYQWGHKKYIFPTTATISSEVGLKESINDFLFPVIVKPNYRNKDWPRDLDKATICNNESEAIDAFKKFKDHAEACLICEFIPGGDVNIETCHVYYDNGNLINYYTDQKIRQYPPLTGTGAFISSCSNDEIKKITIDFFNSFESYTGIGGMEFKKDDRTGTYKIIEPFVGRPSSHFYTGLGEKFNFPYIVYCQMAGLKIPLYKQSGKIVSQLDEEFELQAFRYYLKSGQMTVLKYLKTIFTTQLFVRYSLKDPLVGLAFTFQIFKRLWKRKKSSS